MEQWQILRLLWRAAASRQGCFRGAFYWRSPSSTGKEDLQTPVRGKMTKGPKGTAVTKRREGILSLGEVAATISYDPVTGEFKRLKGKQGCLPDGRIGSRTKAGYWCICVNYRVYMAHRLAWLFMTGAWPTTQVDHINGNRMDNRWENLRLATNQQNQANRKATSICGYKGVSWEKGIRRWRAKIFVDGKRISLGCYGDAIDAALAYNDAAVFYFGEYAKLNEIKP